MGNKVNKIFIILSVLVLVSCSESLDIQLAPEVYVFTSSVSEKKILLSPKDEKYASLNEWLRKHRSDWHSTSGRYPGGVYIESGNYGIQVTKTHVVLYSTNIPEPRAIFIQKIAKRELIEIKNMGK